LIYSFEVSTKKTNNHDFQKEGTILQGNTPWISHPRDLVKTIALNVKKNLNNNYDKLKRYTFLFLFLLSFYAENLHGQSDHTFQNRNSLHFELGGAGGYYSLNYERNIIYHHSFKTSGQVGFSYFPGGWFDISVPVGLNEQFSFSNHHIELGIGMVALREFNGEDDESGERFWSYGLTGRLGYRYQKPGGRFIWRIGFTPLLQRERTRLYYDPHAPFNVFTPWGGISVGYSW